MKEKVYLKLTMKKLQSIHLYWTLFTKTSISQKLLKFYILLKLACN